MQWETNQQDANTREKQLEHIKEIQDVSESTKLSIETITNVLQIIGGIAGKAAGAKKIININKYNQ